MKQLWMARVKGLCLLPLFLLVACSNDFMQIGHSVTECCPGDYSEYLAYGVEHEEMPGFLVEYVTEEFDQAFQEKGLVRNDRLNDIVVTLRYRHVNLNPEQEEIDPFERRIESDVRLRYAATIEVEMRETESGQIVWAGQVNRIHSVLPGQYMHEDRARPAFRAAFRAALESYPALNGSVD